MKPTYLHVVINSFSIVHLWSFRVVIVPHIKDRVLEVQHQLLIPALKCAGRLGIIYDRTLVSSPVFWAWMRPQPSQLNVALIRSWSLICLAYYFRYVINGKPVADRRPVDWCRNQIPLLHIGRTHLIHDHITLSPFMILSSRYCSVDDRSETGYMKPKYL